MNDTGKDADETATGSLRRLIVSVGVVTGALMVSLVALFAGERVSIDELTPVVVASMAAFVVGLTSWAYLQSGRRRERAGLEEARYRQRSLEGEVERLTESDLQLVERVRGIEQRITGGETDPLSPAERKELVGRIKASIQETASEAFVDEVRSSLVSDAHRDSARVVQAAHAETLERIGRELSLLSRRGNLNLVLGIAIAVVGVYFLGVFTLAGDRSETMLEFTDRFVPRLTLVILIEVFAYFFLRLYSKSLLETKYFQNEMTNVEAKAIALETALRSGDSVVVGDVIRIYAKTERNYKLGQDETTVGIEHARIDEEANLSVGKQLARARRKD